jgi:mono/diheme cytochrome c family protein
MKNGGLIFLAVVLTFPLALGAQESGASQAGLTEKQKQGRLLFQQRCPICHSFAYITSKTYGPILDRERVEGNEEVVRNTIMNGRPGRMPAFKYGMTPEEIDSIVDYLGALKEAFERKLVKMQSSPGQNSGNE